MKPNVLIFSGYGLNCEEETKFAFELSGAKADIVHINDISDGYIKLKNYQILAFPGGFSYGDDTGSGNAFAYNVKNHIWEDLQKFVLKDTLVIGICNGFQIITNLGLVPALKQSYGKKQSALLHNSTARYMNRWVDLKVMNDSPWLKGITSMMAPIAHGEGKFYVDEKTLKEMETKKMVALRYYKGEICTHLDLEANPTGTLEGIAGITNENGRILGLMPHPERAIFFNQLPHWTLLKETYTRSGKEVPTDGPGLKIFRNAVDYFT
ncbi:MAG: phosphoribosylformylglycinamidine synthase subunit PurQ [Patescibacteria group bacterium]